MSQSLNEQSQFQDEGVPPNGAPLEQQPAATAAGRAQRSEPERSDGERSGARPAALPSPSFAPGGAMPGQEETGVPDEEMVEASFPEEGYRPPPMAGRSKGRRLVPKTEPPAPALTAEQRLLLLDTWQRSGLPAGDFAAISGIPAHSARYCG